MLGQHFSVVFRRDTETGADLAMGSICNIQRLNAVNMTVIQHTQNKLRTAMLHCKHGSVYDVVCFGIFLTHDLGCQFFDRQSRFHAHSLLSVAVSCITKKAGCRHL